MRDANFPNRPFTRAEAIEIGITDGQLRRASLSAPFHGVRTANPPTDHRERAFVFAPRLRPGQFYSHSTAALLRNVPLPPPIHRATKIHVATFAPQKPPQVRGVIGHRFAPGSVEVVNLGDLPVVDAVSMWVQLGSELTGSDLVAAGDYLLQTPRFPRPGDPRPYCSLEDLRTRVDRFHGNGAAALRAALPLLSAASASRPESALRVLLIEAGLPTPEPNGPISGAGGVVLGFGDLVFRRWKVLVEYDGEQHRTSAAQYARDETRLESMRIAGWLVVRIRKDGLTPGGRADTLARVRSALHSRGWLP